MWIGFGGVKYDTWMPKFSNLNDSIVVKAIAVQIPVPVQTNREISLSWIIPANLTNKKISHSPTFKYRNLCILRLEGKECSYL